MRFTVPQFIEHEVKIVGPLTFKQFIFIGIAGTVCFALYFSIGKVNFFLFLILSIIIFSLGAALAFLKIGGQELPAIIANFLKFTVIPKIYIWQKREQPEIKVYKRKEPSPVKTPEKEEELPLKIAEKSRLKKLHTQIETKTK